MKKIPHLLNIANEITIQNNGRYDDCPDEENWLNYRDGVLAGMLEMLSLFSPVLSTARSFAQRPPNPSKLRKEINNFEKRMGLQLTFKED